MRGRAALGRALGAHDAHAAAFGHRIDDVRLVRAAAPAARARLAPAGGVSYEAASRGQPRDLLRRALRQHSPCVQHDDVIAALGLIEIGGAQQHGQALIVHQLAHDLPQLAPRQRIDADRRLVEQQQLRRAHQRAGQAELLLHAAGEPAGQPAGETAPSAVISISCG